MGLPITQKFDADNRDIYAPVRPSTIRKSLAAHAFTPAANPTDVFAVAAGNYNNIIRVDRVVVTGLAAAAATLPVLLQFAPSNNTGAFTTVSAAAGLGLNAVGALANPYPVGIATGQYYTANKTASGNGQTSSRPLIAVRHLTFGTATTPTSAAEFVFAPGTGPEIRDGNSTIVVNLNGQALPSGATLSVEVQVSEYRVPRISVCADSLFAAAPFLWAKINESGVIAQVAALDNLSTSGIRLTDYLNNTNGIFYHQSAVVPTRSRDVHVIGLGINDVRTGTTQAQLTAMLETAIQTSYAANPTNKIVLISPNMPAADDPTSSNSIPLVGQFAGLTLAQAAQLCGDICYNAYDSFKNDPRIFGLLHRQDILGRTAVTVANSGAAIGLPAPIMTDQLHPNQLGQETVAPPIRALLMRAVIARYANISG